MEVPDDLAGLGSGPLDGPPPPALFRDFKYIILQHLREQGYKEAAHSFERETRLYLDAEHVADLVRRGACDEAERYLGGFTSGVMPDPCSARIFAALRRRKDVEAIDRRINSEEGEGLVNDLKAVAPYDGDVAKMVAALENFRRRELSASARDAMAVKIKELIEANPLFQDKLEFPSFVDSRLRVLVNQSINLQHTHCKKQQNPKLDTLFSDHSCDSKIIPHKKPEQITKSAQKPKQITKSAQKPKQITRSALKPKQITKPAGTAPPAARVRFADQFAGCMTNATPSFPLGVVAEEAPNLVQPPNTAAFRKHQTVSKSDPDLDYLMEIICLPQPYKPPVVDDTGSVSCFASIMAVQLEQPDLLPTVSKSGSVVSLLYTNNGMLLLALRSNAIHNLWKRQCSDTNLNGKSTTPEHQLWRPAYEILMKNDTSHGNPEEATACIALSKNESYVASASGGEVSLFNMKTFQVTSMAPPPSVTFIVFHPQDSNIIAFGMEDSTIQIYNIHVGQVINKLEGHSKKITGLSFSQLKNVLVSSSADAQLCAWSIDNWEKKGSRYMIRHPNHSGPVDGDTRVQFHNDCKRLLVVNARLFAIYNWKLECSIMRSTENEVISSAVFSCDGLLVYAAFSDGTIRIFEVGLKKELCIIPRSGYVQGALYSAGSIYPTPMVVAVHPSERNEIALGMSNGAVIVLELDLATWKISRKHCLLR